MGHCNSLAPMTQDQSTGYFISSRSANYYTKQCVQGLQLFVAKINSNLVIKGGAEITSLYPLCPLVTIMHRSSKFTAIYGQWGDRYTAMHVMKLELKQKNLWRVDLAAAFCYIVMVFRIRFPGHRHGHSWSCCTWHTTKCSAV